MAAGGGRGAAKTHLPTNEAALKQLALTHELPGLVLEHRWVRAEQSWGQVLTTDTAGRRSCQHVTQKYVCSSGAECFACQHTYAVRPCTGHAELAACACTRHPVRLHVQVHSERDEQVD